MLPATGEKAKRLLFASKVESDMMKKLMAFSVGAAMVVFTALANAGSVQMTAPTGAVVLTVNGNIHNTNTEGAAVFDMAMLKALPATTFSTTTIWTEGVGQFTGVQLSDLIKAVAAEGFTLKATAINDYTIEIPMSDAIDGGPILAYEIDGKEMSVRKKGPLWIVYPYDVDNRYQSETIYSRSIWQLSSIEVQQ